MTTTLITGLPRSGTNLVCVCLNTLPDCVALTEPMMVPRHGDADRAVDEIVRFAEATRVRILTERLAPSRTVNGVIADNFFPDATAASGVRVGLHDAGVTTVIIDKPLTPEFRLFIKHPAIFTVLAKPLSARLPLYAIVRHPLAVLASWHTVEMEARHGRWPVAEIYAADLRNQLDRIDSPLMRQVELLRWHFQVYRELPPHRVLTFEAIVHDPGAALRPLSGTNAPLAYPVRNIDLRTRYPGVDLTALATALRTVEADVEPFYPNFAASLDLYLTGTK